MKPNKSIPQELQKIISLHTGYDMMSNLYDRKQIYANQRQLYCMILANEGFSLTSIASTIDKHHSTIITSIQAAEDNLATDNEYKQLYKLIMADLKDAIDNLNSSFLTGFQAQLNEARRKLDKQIESIDIIINELKNKK